MQIRDSAGVTRNAPLFYVSPTQISFQDPSGTSAGAATITVLLNGSTVGQGTTVVEQVTPGLFTANSNGQGVAAAIALRVKADGSQVAEPLLQLNRTTNKYEPLPLSNRRCLGPAFPACLWNRLPQPLIVGKRCRHHRWHNRLTVDGKSTNPVVINVK